MDGAATFTIETVLEGVVPCITTVVNLITLNPALSTLFGLGAVGIAAGVFAKLKRSVK